MRILIVGSGGREHALAWAISRSGKQPTIFCAPGNPGTARHGTNLPIDATDVDGLLRAAQEHNIDLTVVGPEQPLVAGVVDRFRRDGRSIVGPTAAAARLEGSKAFAKDFMQRHNIPTAGYRTFSADEYGAARTYAENQGLPLVIKASGLAGGKGAFICDSDHEVRETLAILFEDRRFGEAADQVVIEEFMEGEEASVFALTDGENYVLLAPAQDHKPIGDGGTGPNTGGMGAYAPAPLVGGALLDQVCREIIEPTLSGMAEDGNPYTGVLYCGLMITADGPRVVEFNCRLGDPEAQVVLPLLLNDTVDVFERMANRDMAGMTLHTSAGAAVCVVLASDGYPAEYETGFEIRGLDEAEEIEDVLIFQAGTRQENGSVRTAGGRVLGITAINTDLKKAVRKAYQAAERISFEGKYLRHDIGQKGIQFAELS